MQGIGTKPLIDAVCETRSVQNAACPGFRPGRYFVRNRQDVVSLARMCVPQARLGRQSILDTSSHKLAIMVVPARGVVGRGGGNRLKEEGRLTQKRYTRPGNAGGGLRKVIRRSSLSNDARWKEHPGRGLVHVKIKYRQLCNQLRDVDRWLACTRRERFETMALPRQRQGLCLQAFLEVTAQQIESS